MDKTTEQRQRDHDENYLICPKCCYSILKTSVGWPTPPAKPQGEAELTRFTFQGRAYQSQEEIVQHFRDSLSHSDSLQSWGVTVKGSQTIICQTGNGPFAESNAIRITEALNRVPEAARVPPESHIMQAARLAEALPASDDADDSASEIISRFEKGAAKPLLVPENPTCPVCLNHRFVVTCIDCQVDLSDHIPSLWDKKYLHEDEDKQSKIAVPLHDQVKSVLEQVHQQREELVTAFIAKHNIGPDEAMIVEKETETGKIWYIEKMPSQPTGRLLEAAKAVVEKWRKPHYDTVPYVFDDLMEKMIKEIKAIEAQGGNEK